MIPTQDVVDLGATAGLRAVEISAVILSALSGIIVASRKRMDLVGTYALAVVTAFGGGTVRDILLDRRPLFWVTYWQYLVVVLALCILVVYSRRAYESASRWQRRFDVVDAAGLALFALSGSHIALQHGMPLFVAIIYGVITASVGGVLRDVLSTEIPTLLPCRCAARHGCICRLRGVRRPARVTRPSAGRGERRVCRDRCAASDIDLARHSSFQHRTGCAHCSARASTRSKTEDRRPKTEGLTSSRYLDVVLRRKKSIRMN